MTGPAVVNREIVNRQSEIDNLTLEKMYLYRAMINSYHGNTRRDLRSPYVAAATFSPFDRALNPKRQTPNQTQRFWVERLVCVV